MKPYRICTIFVLVICCIGLFLRFQKFSSHHPGSYDTKIFYRVFPSAQSFRRAKSNTPIYEALSTNQTLLGYAFYTPDLVSGVQGYSGPIEMVIGIDRQGTIIKADVVHHQETSSYIGKLPHLLDQLKGASTLHSLELGKDVDGISGATITSNAVIDTINQASQKIHSNVSFGPKSQHPLNLKKILAGIVLFILTLYAWTGRYKIFRWASLVASFFLLGLIFKDMLSLSHISGIILGQIPSWHQNPLVYILLTIAIVGGLFFGRIFCAGVCPFAFIQEILSRIRSKFWDHPFSPNLTTDSYCRWIKYIFLILILAACILFKNSNIGAQEVYLTLFTGQGTVAAWCLLITVLVASFFFLRFWCRYLCPFGAFLALISQFQIIKRSCAVPSKISCIENAECLYCDRLLRESFAKSTKKQNNLFLVFICLSIIIFAIGFSQSIKNQDVTRNGQGQKILATTPSEIYIDTEGIKKEINKAGLKPQPAKYWSVIDNGQNNQM